MLTFLAGAELDPVIFRSKWNEATVVGLVGFFGPFLGCTAVAHYLLHWGMRPSWLAGVALSTTSVAVVYAVMLELGFNTTDFGKAILGACFVNDLGTVIALGLIFAPFTVRTLIFVLSSVAVFAILPFVTPRFFRRYGGRVSELEAKYLLFVLFAMGGLAVLPVELVLIPLQQPEQRGCRRLHQHRRGSASFPHSGHQYRKLGDDPPMTNSPAEAPPP